MQAIKHDLSQLPSHHLKGVGKRIAEHLSRLGIHSIQDILFHLPLRYQDRTRVQSLRNLKPGDHAVIEVDIVSVSTPKVGRTRFLCRAMDQSGQVHLRFFYMNSSQRLSLRSGVRLRCFGELRLSNLGLEMIHPEYRILSEELILPVEENLTPVYPTTEGLSQTLLRKLTTQALNFLEQGGVLEEILPQDILKELPNLKEALIYIHRPPPSASLDSLIERKHISQKRLVFEELLAQRLSLLHLKNLYQAQKAYPLQENKKLTDSFIQQLPFELTAAQKKVMSEIATDLDKPHPMLRLVQGDVGSGKTVVAAFALLQAVVNGYQAALLAPTELLAEQHFYTLQRWFKELSLKVVLLKSEMPALLRRITLDAIESGEAEVIVGTHALFQKKVNYKKLALIVVDEQHRFGVEQRSLLREKGIQEACYPHQLIMTATPIPRTLTMSLYADLDSSIINELPPGRTPVTTSVISNEKRASVLDRIRSACTNGRQAYWVCTLITESDILQCQAAEKTALTLTASLPELRIALLHGRMKSNEKETIMQAFKQNEIDLLVATSVIEVGVDVPNASLMVIENAERLGLSQLHQLRGRIGRGSIASHCVLLYQAPLGNLAKERLNVMRETTDGFKIAERDLELRGPGEILGVKQTGEISLRIANLIRDQDLLPDVDIATLQIQNKYPELIEPIIKRWIKQGERFGSV